MPPRPDAIVLAIALFALGVHATTAVVLVVLYPRRWRVQLYVGFLAAMIGWLVALAVRAAGAGGAAWDALAGVTANLLPVVLVLCGVSGLLSSPRRRLLALLGAAVAVAIPLGTGLVPSASWHELSAYHAILWSASVVLFAGSAAVPEPPGPLRGRRRIGWILVPLMLANVILIVANPAYNIEHALPLTSSLAQGLVLVAGLRFRLDGVALRAERIGAERGGGLAREAAELDRLALLGELGAIVAHEVRNPLTGIRSLAQRLEGGERVDDRRRARFAALIVTEVDRLDRFVSSMLALARRETDYSAVAAADAQPAHARVGALFDDLSVLVAARAARRGVRVEMRAEVDDVGAPRGPLAQLLLNLLLNAVEQAPPESAVMLQASRNAGGDVCLVVSDDGPGVAPTTRARLFEAFATGARGTGLGLAVVRRVADMHGWHVTVENRAAGGTAFTLRIPEHAHPGELSDAHTRGGRRAGHPLRAR